MYFQAISTLGVGFKAHREIYRHARGEAQISLNIPSPKSCRLFYRDSQGCLTRKVSVFTIAD